MKDKASCLKFNLTSNMSLELIKFNKLKKELNDLKSKYNKEKDSRLLEIIDKKEKNLIASRNKFIKEFRSNNVNEINDYIKFKDQL